MGAAFFAGGAGSTDLGAGTGALGAGSGAGFVGASIGFFGGTIGAAGVFAGDGDFGAGCNGSKSTGSAFFFYPTLLSEYFHVLSVAKSYGANGEPGCIISKECSWPPIVGCIMVGWYSSGLYISDMGVLLRIFFIYLSTYSGGGATDADAAGKDVAKNGLPGAYALIPVPPKRGGVILADPGPRRLIEGYWAISPAA